MTYALRTIEALFYPVGLIWAVMTVSAFVLWRKKQRGSAFLCAMVSIFIYAIGALPLPEFLMARLERPFAGSKVAAAERADAVIVLGGVMNVSKHDSFGINFSPAADRIFTGMELLKRKKAGAMSIGGGIIKGSSEGERMAEFAKSWNAPGEVIGLAGCRNTHEEALRAGEVARARGWTNLILVTSAYHMPRAMATFEKAGLTVRPVACDFEALPALEGDDASYRIVPVMDHVEVFTLYMHEVLGWYYYVLRGWV